MQEASGALYTIVCVDDEEAVLRSLTKLLVRHFRDTYAIVAASSGEEAIKLIQTLEQSGQTVAMVISDMVMPGMNGDELLVELQALFPSMIKILITGHETSQESVIAAINHADLYRFIAKPLDLEDFLLTVEQGLRKFALMTSLQQKVDEQTKELLEKNQLLLTQNEQIKQAQAQLVQSEKIATLGLLLTGVAHEIKNPAQFAYAGSANLHRRIESLKEFLFELIEEDAEDLRKLLDERFGLMIQNMDAIRDGTQRIQHLASNLHAFSRNATEDVLEPIHLREGLVSTLTLIETNFREKIDFSLDIQADPCVYASSVQMNQVFMNVIVNACQAIVESQEKGLIEGKGEISIVMKLDQGELLFDFVDNGGGIPYEILPRIFEPFFSTKPEGKGSGLGLSITQNIITEHKGRIDVLPLQGGTQMKIYLPLFEESLMPS